MLFLKRCALPLLITALGASLPPQAVAQMAGSPASSYRLHPSDVVEISYRLSPEYDATLTIQPDGFVTVPKIGEVHLASLTLAEARKAIATKSSEYLNAPEVTVSLKDFERPYVTVTGYVTHPGKVEVHGPMTMLRAITVAGGFSEGASRGKVLLVHPIDDVTGETSVIDVARLLKKNTGRPDQELYAGDMVIVGTDLLTKVTRYIKLANASLYIPITK